MTATFSPASARPRWVTLAALGGIGWNIFGLAQFAASVTATESSLIASGLTPEQAAVMTGYPGWMTAVFFLGVAGGLFGSLLLALRSGLARPVLLASLLAYVALWIGDAIHGVFAAMGAPQVIILTLVVAIAAGLFFAATRHSARA
ncbi:hypothetical protein C0V75_19810 [Tabrizicola sp. TH137]|uniref:hypothetical protein n=1 Tax=Tabrizicola sp. TH137 TaxID=2067452 RepID=UPI000C7BAC38|nr:hypothetical protein [Tabrizicola sp. TH137]PLL10576.1 hypothetical protein C0V75_19810 [Tabrizicola sp. TH137]